MHSRTTEIGLEALKSDGKALTVDEEVFKGNNRELNDNEEGKKDNKEAY